MSGSYLYRQLLWHSRMASVWKLNHMLVSVLAGFIIILLTSFVWPVNTHLWCRQIIILRLALICASQCGLVAKSRHVGWACQNSLHCMSEFKFGRTGFDGLGLGSLTLSTVSNSLISVDQSLLSCYSILWSKTCGCVLGIATHFVPQNGAAGIQTPLSSCPMTEHW
jgi:hypothetical protein